MRNCVNFQMTHHDVYIFLKQFGTVMTMKNHMGQSQVVFLRTKAIEQMKTKRSLRINTRQTMEIHWAYDDYWMDNSHWNSIESKPTPSLLLAPDADSPQNILNILNDDCLRPIFEICIRDVTGLCELAKVCTRFEYIVQQMFRAKYRHHHYSWLYKTPIHKKSNSISQNPGANSRLSSCWQSLPLVEDFCRIFGDLIIDFSFGTHDNSDIVNGIIAQYCPNLESFKCSILQRQSLKHIKQLAQHVKQLQIEWQPCNRLDLTVILNHCPHVELLSIGTNSKYGCTNVLLPRKKMPKLIDLRLVGTVFTNNEMIRSFFHQNNQLKRLEVDNIGLSIGADHILDLLPNLESLHIHALYDMYYENINCFGRLKNLKELRFLDYSAHIPYILDAIAKSHVELETLTFHVHVDTVDIVNSVGQMKSLRSLEIGCFHRDHDLTRYVRELPELIELKVNIACLDSALEVLQHAKDGFLDVTFNVNYSCLKIEIMERKLEEIWTAAQLKGFKLTVGHTFIRDENEISVSFSWLDDYFFIFRTKKHILQSKNTFYTQKAHKTNVFRIFCCFEFYRYLFICQFLI